ncbi:MAG: molybdopterin-dependent oxidoreductase [Desulfobacteraceae bacterium]|jgi:anaerobic selenocysteine-containing dehydrogenase
MERIAKASCGRMDHGGCGLLVHIDEGRVTKIKGDPDSFTRGYVCAKGLAHGERLYHPDRLKYPQKRVGRKGENQWKRISWDEAFETITERLLACKSRSAPEKALFMQGTPRGLENMLLYRFAHSFGSPNVAATGTVCFAPRLGASILTNGFYPHPDLKHPPELILVWGANHLATSADGVLAPEVGLTVRRGSRYVLIDPRQSNLASRSEIHMKIKPGRDLLLALGLIKVIIEEELYDREFVEMWTVGFDALRDHVKSYSLSHIEKETWISQEDIKKTSRLYANAGSACILWGNAIDHTINNVQTARGLLILMALSGNLDRPGGNIKASTPRAVRPTEFMLTNKYREISHKMIGASHKLSSMLGFTPYHLAIKAMLHEDPYKIEFAYVQGTNPLMGCPNAEETFKALAKVNFLVVAELFMTPTAQMADMVLPVATHFEFSDLGFYGQPWGKILARPKIVEPPGKCLSDVRILNELAMRLGLEDPFWKDEEACINHILEPSGMNFQALKKKGMMEENKTYEKFKEKGFRTPSGKVELYSSWMEKNGYPPLPVFSSLNDDSEEKWDMILTSAKISVFFHSMNRNLPSLRKRHPEPTVNLHPDTAKNIGVGEGGWIWVENQQGRAKFKVRLNSGINPSVVLAEHAWWFPEKDAVSLYDWNASNINLLTKNDPPYEPTLGSVNLRGFSCRLHKA